ncbi:MAG: type 1 glutamine amidotransferase [Phycisphaeraceae bacterium]|nr:MAG: type 1 glutamine amidotransferase [Phycisphaeraceae bacterium]
MRGPMIGITVDLAEVVSSGGVRLRCEVGLAYARAVREAGGVPVLLPPVAEMVGAYASRCDGFVLTGGNDPAMEMFGEETHPSATVMRPERQAFETALLAAIGDRAPVLGVCLGMQMMALCAGGKLNQHLPETHATAGMHVGKHGLMLDRSAASRLGVAEHAVAGLVDSHHHQAVDSPGRLWVLARSEDGVIEAVHDPARAYWVGVQWHPERTADEALGIGIFRGLVRACDRSV